MWQYLILFVVAVEGGLRVDPLVSTKQGLIKGLRADDGDYSMFLGVPYGKVDENNPFGTAQPYPKFNGTYDAYDDSRICPQVEEFSNEIMGTLDCLRMNIYVPNMASTTNKLPVLVWIHGGGFQSGSGGKYTAGPKFLVRHDIILVTVNYRLGPYGFMCLDIPEVSGNQGLKDQTLALRWIRDNINEFGGDVNKITAYGESAGSASVELHMVSENEKLFNQGILSSGSIYGGLPVRTVDNSSPLKLAKQLGYETNDVKEALTFLKETDVKLVVAAAKAVHVGLGSCREKKFDSVEAFLTQNPNDMKTLPKVKNMGILTGYNENELLITFALQPAEYYSNINPFSDFVKQLGLPDDRIDEAYKIIRHFYIGDEPISESVKWELINFSSDTSFCYPAQKSIEKFQESGAKSIYHYKFAYNGGRNFVKYRFNITEGGAMHADELGYIFDSIVLNKVITEDDQVVVDRLTTMWANFVKYGNPTPSTTDLLPVKWPAVTEQSLYYINIDKDLTVGTRPFHQRLSFWDLFYQAYSEELPQ